MRLIQFTAYTAVLILVASTLIGCGMNPRPDETPDQHTARVEATAQAVESGGQAAAATALIFPPPWGEIAAAVIGAAALAGAQIVRKRTKKP